MADPVRARGTARYFKTGPGQYGEGDRFLGLTVPQLRRLARDYADLANTDLRTLLRSPWHEERLLALLILVRRCERGDARTRAAIYRLYMANRHWVNNWDLVDLSAPGIVGAHLAGGDRSPLRTLATSKVLWDRRIAIIATLWFIRSDDFADTLAVARMLLDDPHDLIHKAAGWMLREVAHRDRDVVERFLDRYGDRMPRTMLRYAIERFPPRQRAHYLARPRARQAATPR
jgi:3-methyladenine DNA glycosylase AlkD